MTKKKIVLLFFIIFAVCSITLAIAKEGVVYEEVRTFKEAISIIKEHYVGDVEARDLIQAAIEGMIESLDPHSTFLTQEELKEKTIRMKGEFAGVGIQIGMRDENLTVISPIEGTPAYKAGLKAGDIIIKIDHEPAEAMSLSEAVSRIRGEIGTPVILTILRDKLEEPKDFDITREIIEIVSVRYELLEEGIGYIRISAFQTKTAKELSDALSILTQEKEISSLIVDLRNNPGGLLSSAVDVAGQFLPEGKLVVYIKDGQDRRTNFYARGIRLDYALPMVVLVNRGSASASEIVAGALGDWDRAVILGEQTFGKGTVQSLIPLHDGSAINLTTAIYYTPKGIPIKEEGITPRIIVEAVIEEDEDIQLQRAIDLLRTWEIFRELPGAA
ncbi:S41 family peptidase [Thermodesulfovibrionales bacterium]|nr:S41 family peptidase [Thermodesulfovibrionales bacterium]MCL0083712.1 S41 family peptidase [Thermodesulfovibrionales bacterium]MCL0085053.1 S41 family peptidase [Thermodesulfovibrionales bacterium]